MAWIKFDHTTLNKPEVFLISQRLEINRAETLGHLVALWVWFDQVSEDGTIKGNKAMVDSLSLPGFADTLIELNWLREIGDKLELPNFCNHNGQTAKQRCQAQSRQAKFRNNANGVTKPPLEKRREEKIREDNNTYLRNKPNKPGGVLVEFKEEKKTDQTPYAKITEIWNEAAAGTNCPKATRLSKKRKSQIKALCNDYTIEEITATFQKLVNIPFMTGQNQRGWIANIDYATRADPFLRIFEDGENNNQKPDFDEWAN